MNRPLSPHQYKPGDTVVRDGPTRHHVGVDRGSTYRVSEVRPNGRAIKLEGKAGWFTAALFQPAPATSPLAAHAAKLEAEAKGIADRAAGLRKLDALLNEATAIFKRMTPAEQAVLVNAQARGFAF